MGEVATEHNERKRLHITPFTPTLLDRFIPPSLTASASGISFHTVETFPDRGFGYLELPVMEADKLKKKLNGMTLKGTKVRIEDAKPEKKRKVEANNVEEEDERKEKKRSKREKRKREEGVLPGHELGEGRRVKRGWTEDGKEKKRDKKSKKAKVEADDGGIEGKKLRFKTIVPPNVMPLESEAKSKSKEKKDKKSGKDKRKTVVEESSKTRKLAGSGKSVASEKQAVQYEDGKGWTNEDGDVVEAAPKSKRPKRGQPMPSVPEKPAETEIDDEPAVENASSSESEDAEDASEDEAPEAGNQLRASVSPSTAPIQHDTPTHATPEAMKEVHPLEALFKRPAPKPDTPTKPKPSPIDTSFNFFTSAATDDAEDDDTVFPPQTPHTREDMEWRSIRSAAPTPDTAAIGKTFDFSMADYDDEEEEDDAEEGAVEAMPDIVEEEAELGPVETGAGAGAGAVNGGKEESEFRKWFYDNRGDLNRGWKKRRRDERKQKRQRENKRLGRRVA